MQRSQGSHLAKAFVHRAGCIQQDSFLSITFLVSDVLRYVCLSSLSVYCKTTNYFTLTQLGCQECTKSKLENEQLRWHVSPHSFCEAFLNSYRFFSRRDARSSVVTAAGDSSEVIMWSLGWFETSEQLLGSEVGAVTHPAGLFLFSFSFLFFSRDAVSHQAFAFS